MGKVLTKQLQAQLEANSAEMANNGASEEEIQQMAFAFVEQFGVDEKKKESVKSGVSLDGSSNTGNTKKAGGYFQSPQSKGIDLLRGRSVKPTSEYIQTKKVEGVLPDDKKVELSRETFKQYKKTKLIPESVKAKLGDDRAKAIIEKTDWDNIDESTKFNIEKDKRNEVLSSSSVNDLVDNYSKGIIYATNPTSFIQSREGKVGSLLKKVQDGEIIGQNDAEYISKHAPAAWNEITQTVKENSDSFDDQNPAQSISAFYKANRKSQLQNYYSGVAANAVKEVGDLGFDISKLGDNEYTAMSMAKVGQLYADKLAEIEKKYPETIRYEQRGTKDIPIRERAPEYFKEKEKIDELKSDVFSKIGFASAVKFAVENPTKSSEEVGEIYMSIANPERYKNFVQGGKKSPIIKAELSKMGISALLGNGNEVSADMAIQDQKDFNENYPKQKMDELYHRLGAEWYKKGGKLESFITRKPTIEELDEIANSQFSDEDRDFYLSRW